MGSTLPLAVTVTLPQASLAVAPGSVKLAWHSTVSGLAPARVIAGVGPARVIGPETGVLIGVPSCKVPASTPLTTASPHPETVTVPPKLFPRPPPIEPPEMDSVPPLASRVPLTEPPEIVPVQPALTCKAT